MKEGRPSCQEGRTKRNREQLKQQLGLGLKAVTYQSAFGSTTQQGVKAFTPPSLFRPSATLFFWPFDKGFFFFLFISSVGTKKNNEKVEKVERDYFFVLYLKDLPDFNRISRFLSI